MRRSRYPSERRRPCPALCRALRQHATALSGPAPRRLAIKGTEAVRSVCTAWVLTLLAGSRPGPRLSDSVIGCPNCIRDVTAGACGGIRPTHGANE